MTSRLLSLALSGIFVIAGSVQAQITPQEGAPGMKGAHPMMQAEMHSPRMHEGKPLHMGLHQLFMGSGKPGAGMQTEQIDKMVGHLMVEIGGTPEQRRKITGIALAARSDMQAMREQMQMQRQKGMDLMFAKTLDTQALDKQHAEHNQLREKMGNRMHRGMVEALQVLTPEQRAQMKQKMQSGMQSNHAHKHGAESSSAMPSKPQTSMPAQR
jgi:Spy/CpxP family protein refolding chaperone